MPASKAQQKAVNKYVKSNYDLYQIKMPKGKKDDIKAIASVSNESMNQYIINAVNQRIERDTGTAGSPQEAAGATIEDRGISLSPDTLKAAQTAAQATGEGIPEFIARAVDTQVQRDQTSLKLGINPATGEKRERE